MLKLMYPRRLRRVAVTLTAPHRRGTLSHHNIPARLTVGQLLQWVTHSIHRAADYRYVLRDERTGRLLAGDETLGQLARQHGKHVRLTLHVDPRMA